ncbi:MAG: saccharopine dehydrogenase NADP-binding domain-containing protein [Bacteroidetes bacterium]|nr:saccharopine dehydrogenase NADP-binding domain-containing protein [Bacteroidota bacterium]MDA1119341.1 saccharopine dehydrogenase NADP-binding domain-containing protein [Bacteroidota bacterium]
MSDGNFLIYGANEYTGELITRRATALGLKPILAGRNRDQIQALASSLGLEYLVFDLSDDDEIRRNIAPFKIVLHCAGPFSKTARPMIKACLDVKIHYLDITGEIEIFEYCASKDKQAHEAGIILMPGVGFDVVPTDCLAAYLASLLPEATHLELAFKGSGAISKGTALTMLENSHKGGAIRQNSTIISVPVAYESKTILLEEKEISITTIPWGDVSTAFYSTGIPNIKVYTAVKPEGIKRMKLMNSLDWLIKMPIIKNYFRRKVNQIKGPSEDLRNSGKSIIWGRVFNEEQQFEAMLTTPEGYQLTALTSIAIVQKLLIDHIFSGYKTPSMAFGPDFILEIENTNRTNL